MHFQYFELHFYTAELLLKVLLRHIMSIVCKLSIKKPVGCLCL